MPLKPKEIVEALDLFIVGQEKAKRAVAIALRNRWRRQQVPESLREEIFPNNIIMIGPTGVGKTEIARRLAHLANAPFLKVEATKFTEIGYVGRDVESMIRDLVAIAYHMVEEEHEYLVWEMAEKIAEERVLDILFPVKEKDTNDDIERDRMNKTREKLKEMYKNGQFDDRYIEIDVPDMSGVGGISIMGPMGDGGGLDEASDFLNNAMSNLFGKKRKKKKVKVIEAKEIITAQEAEKLVDKSKVQQEALSRVENDGIIFLDEIDKITTSSNSSHSVDVSRQGVQRDLLPIVEGSTVNTRYGVVKTDHILFIAAGSFHTSKPSDLIPELQGRFPIRVELDSLTTEDFVKILIHPQNALIKQYQALLQAEGIELIVKEDAIRVIAEKATEVNEKTENIGARRLHTILTHILDDVMFNAPDTSKKVVLDAKMVHDNLDDIVTDVDMSRYIL
ncbi:MAG: ATP-dependent protease ATPase subunit HslU [Candidatus Marinimicrobia bacterium]|nr:ATP-dependent protease ATPase subunit HslU [Candidatus Neomarinimicrobiota bacterium]